jgi:endonuclease-3
MVPITPLSKLNNKEENPTTPTKSANKSEDNEKITTPSSRKKKSPKTSSSSRKRQRIIPGSLDPPKNWEKIYSIVEELRADKTAPLDTDGGEALPERHLGEKVYRFQVLVALMLSSQTKDAVVGDAMRAMQKHGLTVENIHATDALMLNGLINKVGFHNNKTKYLKQVAEILINEYDCDIPPTADEMIKSLSGVGPKMAYIVENVAFGISTGIGVDTHMHRIFNDIKWVNSKTPEQTREQLEGWLPKERWIEVNMLWVGFGQESQQQKEKILKKALKSSRPIEALNLLKKVGLNVAKEGKKYGLEDDIKNAYNAISNKE